MQALKLARKYPNFSQGEMMQLVEQFKSVLVPIPPHLALDSPCRPRAGPQLGQHRSMSYCGGIAARNPGQLVRLPRARDDTCCLRHPGSNLRQHTGHQRLADSSESP
jgi:hypothetical protein